MQLFLTMCNTKIRHYVKVLQPPFFLTFSDITLCCPTAFAFEKKIVRILLSPDVNTLVMVKNTENCSHLSEE